ncbi:cilia- and flagella-associated protein 251 [Clinocottus analis]|uniref:cilia- and flagella-associated protein 251 n=1 Tax=Clinocottus analis TaxID=304258 RepID=UPI0035C039B9
MTIGKNSRNGSVRSSIRAPKFLDKSSGFYGRLDEPEAAGEGGEVRGEEVEEMCSKTGDSSRDRGVASSPSMLYTSGADEREEVEAFDLDEGMMEDDGETLLQRKPSRRSSRWRRSSRRKEKVVRGEEHVAQDDGRSLGTGSPSDPHCPEDSRGMIEVETEEEKETEEGKEDAWRGMEHALAHFPIRGDADDQVLIRDNKREREEEGEEERRMQREQEEAKKVVKRNTVKNYRKALDRALRRGWEAFITNLYSVTLTPVTSSSQPSSSPSLKKKQQHKSVLAEFQ